MGPDYHIIATTAVTVVAIAGMLVVVIAGRFPDLFEGKSKLNSRADWTPAPEYSQEAVPAGTCLAPYELQLITSYLDEEETLEGFAEAFFLPRRFNDWKYADGFSPRSLLVAATSHRILLFEVTVPTVHRFCFIPYDDIAYLRPPKSRLLGTSGNMRFGLKSGREYQMGLVGPLFSEEGMKQEQKMAAYLRQIAPRFGFSPDRAAA